MATMRIKIDALRSKTMPRGQVDYKMLDSTTEQDLDQQIRQDTLENMAKVIDTFTINFFALTMK